MLPQLETEHGNRKLQFLVALSVSLAFVGIGITGRWVTPVMTKFHNNETSVNITDQQISWLVSINSPSFLVGSLIAQFMADRYGRQPTILWSGVPIFIGTVIVAFATNAWLLLITIFAWNCTTGMICTVIHIYLAEIAEGENNIRDTLAMYTRCGTNLGNFLVLLVGSLISYESLNYALLVIPVCYFAGCWWIPETPFFYLKVKNEEAAKKTLQKLQRFKDPNMLNARVSQMKADVDKEMSQSSGFMELITEIEYRKAIIISIGLKITQLMTGIVTIQQYLGRIIQESHITLDVSTVVIIFGAVSFVVSFNSSILVERFGRRPLLIYSYLGTGLCLAIVGVYYFCQEVLLIGNDTMTTFGFVPFAGITLANIISTVGFNSVAGLIPPVIFPMNVKTVAMTSLNVLGALLGFVVGKMYQSIKDIGGLCTVFWIFACVAFFGIIFVYFYVPETKDKSLRDILKEVQGKYYKETGKNLVVSNGTHTEGTELEILNKKESTN